MGLFRTFESRKQVVAHPLKVIFGLLVVSLSFRAGSLGFSLRVAGLHDRCDVASILAQIGFDEVELIAFAFLEHGILLFGRLHIDLLLL